MTFLEVLDKNLIKVPMLASDAPSAIEELVSLYAEATGLSKKEEERIGGLIKDRERLGSTAMENGVAIPHAKITGLEKAAVVIGISRKAIDFGGEKPSSLFFLVLAPEESPAEHIQILSSIAKLASSELFLKMLMSSKTSDEAYNLFFE